MAALVTPAIFNTVTRKPEPSVLKLEGDLELLTRSSVRERLATLAASQYAIVDLSDACICDATFLGDLARLRKTTSTAGTVIVLVTSNPMVRRVLRLVQFDRIFPVVATVAQARQLIESC